MTVTWLRPWLLPQTSSGQDGSLILCEVAFQDSGTHIAAQCCEALRGSSFAQGVLALQGTEERVPEQVHVSLEDLQPVCQAEIEQGALCQTNLLSLKPLGSPCTDLFFHYQLHSALEDMALFA